MSYARAKETFFTSGSPWELNLPQRTLQQLLHPQTPHPGLKSHPHPSVLSAVRFEIDAYLNDSLTRYMLATRTLFSHQLRALPIPDLTFRPFFVGLLCNMAATRDATGASLP